MPRTCEHPGPSPSGVENPTGQCAINAPSFTATWPKDRSPDDILGRPLTYQVCDVHKPDAEADGYEVGPYMAPSTRRRLDRAAAQAQVETDAVATLAEIHVATADRDDAELTTLATIAETMRDLGDDDTRRRVAVWVADRYGADA